MATVVPHHIPASASQGERRVHRVLSGLPADCVVYYEPRIGGRHPDFVVVLPRLGVLVIEVKGWYARQILRGDADSVRVLWDGVEKMEKHPARQARDYLFALMDTARAHRWSKCLLREEGRFEGKFRFPFAHVVVLSNITGKSVADNGFDPGDWERIFPGDRTMDRSRLEELEGLEGEALVEALRPYIRPFWSFPPLGDEQVKALRAVIHPEILLGDGVSLARLEGEPRVLDDRQDVLRVMDLQQEEHAQALGSGHRLIYGVAGSGKTIILLARARRLAETGTKRILVTCYNRTLAAWMAEQLAGHPAITVLNFHAWAWRSGFREFPDDRDEEWAGRFLAHLGSDRGRPERYDAVLVDEAQDFEPDWFRCLLAAMNDPEDGDLLIVADGCQSLYRRARINWSALGIKARGRTISGNYQLDRNYRNPREIIALAESFACAAVDDAGLDAIHSVRVNMRDCERGTGASPRLIWCGSRREELREAAEIVDDLLRGTWQGRPTAKLVPGEIAILYPSLDEADRPLLEEFTAWLGRRTPALWLGAAREARDRVSDEGVKIQTIHSAKGLQYRAVVLVWADKLPRRGLAGEELVGERRQLYVAMTRAMSFLAITASGRSPFLEEIAGAPGLVVSARRAPVAGEFEAGESRPMAG